MDQMYPGGLKSPLFYNTTIVDEKGGGAWGRSLRTEEPIIYMDTTPTFRYGSRQSNVSAESHESENSKPCTACRRPTRRDVSHPDYWRRVRSLSRDNKSRMQAKENELRLLELEEQKRRKEILDKRKKERDDLTDRFLRAPVRPGSPCIRKVTNMTKNDISRSVPDLKQPFGRNKIKSDTRSELPYPSVPMSSISRSVSQHDVNEALQSRHSSKHESQKAYPVGQSDKLSQRHKPLKTNTKPCWTSDTSIATDHNKLFAPPMTTQLIILPKPTFERRRSMPDLQQMSFVKSTQIYESVTKLEALTDVKSCMILADFRHEQIQSNTNLGVLRSQNQVSEPKINTNNKKKFRRSISSQFKETKKQWISQQMSSKSLMKVVKQPDRQSSQNIVLPLLPTIPLDYIKPITGSDDNDDSYYDSLEEDSVEFKKRRQKAYYVPLDSPKTDKPIDKFVLPPRLASRLKYLPNPQNEGSIGLHSCTENQTFSHDKEHRVIMTEIYPLDTTKLHSNFSSTDPNKLPLIPSRPSSGLVLTEHGNNVLPSTQIPDESDYKNNLSTNKLACNTHQCNNPPDEISNDSGEETVDELSSIPSDNELIEAGRQRTFSISATSNSQSIGELSDVNEEAAVDHEIATLLIDASYLEEKYQYTSASSDIIGPKNPNNSYMELSYEKHIVGYAGGEKDALLESGFAEEDHSSSESDTSSVQNSFDNTEGEFSADSINEKRNFAQNSKQANEEYVNDNTKLEEGIKCMERELSTLVDSDGEIEDGTESNASSDRITVIRRPRSSPKIYQEETLPHSDSKARITSQDTDKEKEEFFPSLSPEKDLEVLDNNVENYDDKSETLTNLKIAPVEPNNVEMVPINSPVNNTTNVTEETNVFRMSKSSIINLDVDTDIFMRNMLVNCAERDLINMAIAENVTQSSTEDSIGLDLLDDTSLDGSHININRNLELGNSDGSPSLDLDRSPAVIELPSTLSTIEEENEVSTTTYEDYKSEGGISDDGTFETLSEKSFRSFELAPTESEPTPDNKDGAVSTKCKTMACHDASTTDNAVSSVNKICSIPENTNSTGVKFEITNEAEKYANESRDDAEILSNFNRNYKTKIDTCKQNRYLQRTLSLDIDDSLIENQRCELPENHIKDLEATQNDIFNESITQPVSDIPSCHSIEGGDNVLEKELSNSSCGTMCSSIQEQTNHKEHKKSSECSPNSSVMSDNEISDAIPEISSLSYTHDITVDSSFKSISVDATETLDSEDKSSHIFVRAKTEHCSVNEQQFKKVESNKQTHKNSVKSTEHKELEIPVKPNRKHTSANVNKNSSGNAKMTMKSASDSVGSQKIKPPSSLAKPNKKISSISSIKSKPKTISAEQSHVKLNNTIARKTTALNRENGSSKSQDIEINSNRKIEISPAKCSDVDTLTRVSNVSNCNNDTESLYGNMQKSDVDNFLVENTDEAQCTDLCHNEASGELLSESDSCEISNEIHLPCKLAQTEREASGQHINNLILKDDTSKKHQSTGISAASSVMQEHIGHEDNDCQKIHSNDNMMETKCGALNNMTEKIYMSSNENNQFNVMQINDGLDNSSDSKDVFHQINKIDTEFLTDNNGYLTSITTIDLKSETCIKKYNDEAAEKRNTVEDWQVSKLQKSDPNSHKEIISMNRDAILSANNEKRHDAESGRSNKTFVSSNNETSSEKMNCNLRDDQLLSNMDKISINDKHPEFKSKKLELDQQKISSKNDGEFESQIVEENHNPTNETKETALNKNLSLETPYSSLEKMPNDNRNIMTTSNTDSESTDIINASNSRKSSEFQTSGQYNNCRSVPTHSSSNDSIGETVSDETVCNDMRHAVQSNSNAHKKNNETMSNQDILFESSCSGSEKITCVMKPEEEEKICENKQMNHEQHVISTTEDQISECIPNCTSASTYSSCNVSMGGTESDYKLSNGIVWAPDVEVIELKYIERSKIQEAQIESNISENINHELSNKDASCKSPCCSLEGGVNCSVKDKKDDSCENTNVNNKQNVKTSTETRASDNNTLDDICVSIHSNKNKNITISKGKLDEKLFNDIHYTSDEGVTQQQCIDILEIQKVQRRCNTSEKVDEALSNHDTLCGNSCCIIEDVANYNLKVVNDSKNCDNINTNIKHDIENFTEHQISDHIVNCTNPSSSPRKNTIGKTESDNVRSTLDGQDTNKLKIQEVQIDHDTTDQTSKDMSVQYNILENSTCSLEDMTDHKREITAGDTKDEDTNFNDMQNFRKSPELQIEDHIVTCPPKFTDKSDETLTMDIQSRSDDQMQKVISDAQNENYSATSRPQRSLSEDSIPEDMEPNIIENGAQNSKTPSSDSGIVELTGNNSIRHSDSSIVSPVSVQNHVSFSNHYEKDEQIPIESDSEQSNLATIVSERSVSLKSDISSDHSEMHIVNSEDELLNSSKNSDSSDTSSVFREKFLHRYLENQACKEAVGSWKKKRSISSSKISMASDDHDEDGQASRLFQTIQNRRKRRKHFGSCSVDEFQGKTKSPALSSLNTFLNSHPNYVNTLHVLNTPNSKTKQTKIEHLGEQEVEPYGELSLEVVSGKQKHNINLKTEGEAELFVKVISPKFPVNQQFHHPTKKKLNASQPELVGNCSLVTSSKFKTNIYQQKVRHQKAVKQPKVNNFFQDIPMQRQPNAAVRCHPIQRSSSLGEFIIEGNCIAKCFGPPSPGHTRRFLSPHNRVSPESIQNLPNPEVKEQKRIQKSIKLIRSLLKTMA